MAENRKTDIKKKTSKIGIRAKLLFWLLFIALLPIVAISYFGYQLSADSLYTVTSNRLQSTLSLQQQALDNYFIEREKNLASITDDVDASQLRTYASLAAIKTARHKVLTKFFKGHKRDIEIYAKSPRQQKTFSQLIAAPSKGLNTKDISFLTSWLGDRDLQSFLLVQPDGKVLYATDDTIKLGTEIKKQTPEGEALQNGSREASFTDFALSSLYPGEPAGYFSVPFKSDNILAAVLLFRLKNNAFDEIMQDRTNLGESGETFLVGPDGMFRSNSRYFEESTVLNPAFPVDTESVAGALVGIDGEQLVVNYRGEYVLSSYMPLEIGGSTWALIAEIDQHEAVAPKLGEGEDYLKRTATLYGFPDLYLIDSDGYMFYSTRHQSDYQTNLITGPHMNSGLAKTVLKVLDSKAQVVSDYSLYKPAGYKPAAFLAKPIMR
ncbi:MAG: cache domain-containing protein, partial [Desulfobacterales bacterium]|nr:cache domain-containing protein [Desulfobacterales bacterium]